MRACLNGSKSEFSQIIENVLGSVFYIYYDYDSYCVWIKYAIIYICEYLCFHTLNEYYNIEFDIIIITDAWMYLSNVRSYGTSEVKSAYT